MTAISWLTLFRETVPVYTENHTNHTESLTAKAGDTQSYHLFDHAPRFQ